MVYAKLPTPDRNPMLDVEALARGHLHDGTSGTMLHTTTSHAAFNDARIPATLGRAALSRTLAIAACVLLLPLAACSTAAGPREARLQLRANPIDAFEFGAPDLALAGGAAGAAGSSSPTAPEVRLAHWPWARGDSQGSAGVFASLPGDASRPLASRGAAAPETLAAEFTQSLRPAP